MHVLKQYIKDQNTIFITRDGTRVKIVDIDDGSDEYPLVANIIETDTEIWLTASGNYYSGESVIKEHNYDIIGYEKPEQQRLNVGEIYRLHPDAVFITRGGTKVKVTGTRPYVAVIESLDGKMTYSVDGTTGIFISPDKPDPLDIVNYEKPEQPTTFTVGEYVTRDGRKAIVHYDISETLPNGTHTLFGYIKGEDGSRVWDIDGSVNWNGYADDDADLIGPWVEPPYTITVNGKEFHPVKNPKNGEKYFYISTAAITVSQHSTWDITNPTGIDVLLANLNLIYRTKEEAQAFLDEITKPNAEIKYGT